MSYNTEAEFSRMISGKLKSEGCSCLRIETAGTASGVPDMLVMTKGDDWFVEFKNMKGVSIDRGSWKIQWRPGQQAFGAEYMKRHTRRVLTYGSQKDALVVLSKCSWTFAALDGGVLLIRMGSLREDGTVCRGDPDVFVLTYPELRKKCLHMFLKEQGYILRGDLEEYSMEEQVMMAVDAVCMNLMIDPELIEWDFDVLLRAGTGPDGRLDMNALRREITCWIKSARDTYLGVYNM